MLTVAIFPEVATAERPAVRVNQLGYLPGAPKRATLVSDATAPLDFVVTAGDVVWRGRSQPWPRRPEPTSGLAVHVLDFSAAPVVGDGVRITVGESRSHAFRVAPDLYHRVADDALRFFSLMRSGCAIEAPGYVRPAGRLGDAAVPAWSGEDARRLYPGWHAEGRFDVSGGWYDAGDYGKYVVSGSLPLWQLLPLVEVPSVAAECRWQLDWMVRMLVPPGRALAGMAFHRVHGVTWSPMPGWPHEDPTERVLHRPSTAATLHVCAVAAQGARVLAALDPPYAQRLLAVARTTHAAAHAQPTLIAPDDHGRFGGGPYPDDRLDDDFYWAAAELWLTTGEQPFLDEVTASPHHFSDVFDPAGFDFDAMACPARLDLAIVASALPGHRRRPQDHRRASVPRRGRHGDGLPVRPQRARPELRHGARDRLQPPSTDAAVRPRPRPRLPAPAPRGAGGRRELARAPRLPDRPPPGPPSTAALLPRRTDI